jgi:hypothetical protein
MSGAGGAPDRPETGGSADGGGAVLTVDQTSVSFGRIPVNSYPTRTVTVTALVDLTDLAVRSTEWVVRVESASTCGEVLAAGQSCTVVLGLAAGSPGEIQDSLVIRAGGQSVTIPITATVYPI